MATSATWRRPRQDDAGVSCLARTGSRPLTWVPPPGWARRSSEPRSAAMRSIMFWMPEPPRALEQLPGLPRVLLCHPLRRRELQLQRYQVLLRAVVQVALDPAPLGVLRRDQALPGHRQLFQPLAELGGKALILEREPRLVRQVVNQPGLGRRDVLTF